MHKKIALDLSVMEREMNRALRENVVVEGDGIDSELEDLERTWMVEDVWVMVGKVDSGCFVGVGFGVTMHGRRRSTFGSMFAYI
jgi:hypothetical protein